MKRPLSAVATALLAAALPGPAATPDHPNILFIFADDLSWEGVRALSGLDIDTPHLDRLAGRGTTFTHAYNSGAWHGAVCVASRTMLNTGLQLWDARRAEPKLRGEFAAKGRFWSQRLSRAGYTTCFAGKWHIKADPEAVFDHVRNVRPGMPGSVKAAYNRPIEGKPDPWRSDDRSLGGYWKGGKHWSEVLADDFEHLLGKAKEKDNPWFIYLAFNAPHDPRQAPGEYVARYPLKRVAIPDDYLPLYPHREAMGAGERLRDEKLAPFPRTPFAVKTHRREYFALISHLDTQIGRILGALEASGDAADTVIIFTSDHGLACGHHGLLGKQNMYDHSVRVPFLVAGPGIPAGHAVDAPIYLQDAMPTTLELAGATRPDDTAFESVLPLLRGETPGRKAVFGAYMDRQRMVTAGNKKLILYPTAKVAKLYDLARDPGESTDLIGRAESLEPARSLFATLRELLGSHGDSLDLSETFPTLAGP